VETKDMGFQLEQVQGFTPTPMTVATVIYYSGYHPYTLKPVYTPRTPKERDEQHRFFFWYKKENRSWIRRTLEKSQRAKLIDKLLGFKKPDTALAKRKPSGFKRSKRERRK
jgi:radical SAM superfamily enzyme YgiQ (UPF0313 family)